MLFGTFGVGRMVGNSSNEASAGPRQPKSNSMLIAGFSIVVTVVVVLAALFAAGIITLKSSNSGDNNNPSDNNPQNQPAQTEQYGSMVIEVTDKETGKPVGRVIDGYVNVILGGIDRGFLGDDGKLQIDGIAAGMQELKLVIPEYGSERYTVDIVPNQTNYVKIDVDMPNPVFSQPAVTCNVAWWQFWGETGTVTVTLSNTGKIASLNTQVLVLAFNADTKLVIDSEILSFGYMQRQELGGTPVTKDGVLNFVWGPREYVAILVLEGWPYTPVYSTIENPLLIENNILVDLTYSAALYLENNPDLIIGGLQSIAKYVFAWYG